MIVALSNGDDTAKKEEAATLASDVVAESNAIARDVCVAIAAISALGDSPKAADALKGYLQSSGATEPEVLALARSLATEVGDAELRRLSELITEEGSV